MSEITTAELVKALRCDGIKCDCGGCFYRNENGCILSVQMNDAADCLEQQEQRIAGMERELEWKDKVIELAQRKQDEAERELAAAKEDMHHNDACKVCVGSQKAVDGCDCECLTCKLDCRCKDCRDENKWEWRGAREGEGK